MKVMVDGSGAFVATGGRAFDPEQPALIFVHGAGMDHTVWTLQTRYFAHHGWSVLAVDLPGHGASEGPALTAVEDMASWIARLAAALGLSRTAYVGHSMGALIALEAAAADPNPLGLVMMGAAAAMPVNPALLKAAESGDHRAVESMIGWGVGRPLQIGGNAAPGSWVAGASLRVLERGLRGSLAVDLAASDAYARAVEAAAAVRCPVLMVAGDDDRMAPVKGARALLERFSDGRLAVLPATGHMMSIERPDETLDAVRAFLRDVDA